MKYQEKINILTEVIKEKTKSLGVANTKFDDFNTARQIAGLKEIRDEYFDKIGYKPHSERQKEIEFQNEL